MVTKRHRKAPWWQELVRQLILQGYDEDQAKRLANLEEAIDRASKRTRSSTKYGGGGEFVEL